MKTLRRKWPILALGASTLVVAVMVWSWTTRLSATAALIQDSPTYPPLTDTERGGVLQVLTGIALDEDALAALNLSSDQAESILNSARTWYFEHQQELAAAHSAVATSRRAWDDALSNMRSGVSDDASALSAAAADLAAAEATLTATLGSLRTAVTLVCSESQLASWAILESNQGRGAPFGLLSLDSVQSAQLADASIKLRSDLASAVDGNGRIAARAAWGTSVDTILTDANETMVESYESYCETSEANVVAAIDTVLPIES